MSIGLTPKLVEVATKIVTTRNGANDLVYGATTTTICLYRDISMLNRNQNRETVQIDGLLWFDADEQVKRGDIYYHPDEGYLRIERVVRAKRLLIDNVRKFIKCEVTKQRQVS